MDGGLRNAEHYWQCDGIQPQWYRSDGIRKSEFFVQECYVYGYVYLAGQYVQ